MRRPGREPRPRGPGGAAWPICACNIPAGNRPMRQGLRVLL